MNFTAADLDKMLAQHRQASGAAPQPLQPVQMTSGRRPARALSGRRRLLTDLLGGLFLAGVLAGALLCGRCSPETMGVLRAVLGGFAQTRQVQSFAGIAASTFGSLFLLLAVLFFCGFCSIAQPIILLVPLFKGLGYGFSAGVLYMEYGLDAMRYVALLLFPAVALGAALLVAASRSSFLFSVRLFHASLSNSGLSDLQRIKRYCVKFLIFTVFCLLISLLNAAIYLKFGGLLLV